MKYTNSKRKIPICRMMVATFLISFVAVGVAQEDTGTVTGRVFDLGG